METEPSAGGNPASGQSESTTDDGSDDQPQYAPPPYITGTVSGPGADETIHGWVTEQTTRELRVYIARKVGQKTTPHTPIDIDTLNSVNAYLSGSFYAEPRVVGTSTSPGRGPIREAIVHDVLAWEQEQDDRGGDVVGTMANYFPDPDGTNESWDPTPFRLDELRALANCIYDTDDHRGGL